MSTLKSMFKGELPEFIEVNQVDTNFFPRGGIEHFIFHFVLEGFNVSVLMFSNPDLINVVEAQIGNFKLNKPVLIKSEMIETAVVEKISPVED